MSMHADTPPTSRSEVPEGMHGDIHALSDHCLIRQLGQHASNVASNACIALEEVRAFAVADCTGARFAIQLLPN